MGRRYAAAALERRWTGYALSVLPALLGWASLLIPTRLGLGLQATAFLALLAYISGPYRPAMELPTQSQAYIHV